jgi:hypothetical protein
MQKVCRTSNFGFRQGYAQLVSIGARGCRKKSFCLGRIAEAVEFSCLTCFKDPTASDLSVSCARVATLRMGGVRRGAMCGRWPVAVCWWRTSLLCRGCVRSGDGHRRIPGAGSGGRAGTCARGHRSNSTGCGVSGVASVRRMIPSQMLIDGPRGVTSQRRACRSMCASDACTCRRTRTGPITSRSAAWGSLVKVRTSGRASRRRLSVGPADKPTAVPAMDGVGSAGS